MNVIIVSFPLVFHIINLPVCSCISVWALTESIQTLCCAVSQITQAHARAGARAHEHNSAPWLSVIYYGSDNYDQQSHGNYRSIQCQCLWWALSLAALHFLCCFFPQCTVKNISRKWSTGYQMPLQYKFTPLPDDIREARSGKHNSQSATVSFVGRSESPVLWKEEKKRRRLVLKLDNSKE